MASKTPGTAFDRPDGYSGQDYHRDREAADGAKAPSGHPRGGPGGPPEDAEGRDLPPDAGRRGGFDPKTGEVYGSGAGDGGGAGTDDYDPNTAGGAPEAPEAGAGPDRPGPEGAPGR